MNIEWLKSEDACTLYTRGHVDKGEFFRVCIDYEGCSLSQYNLPEHEWFRVLPTQDKSYKVIFAAPGSRGAFPVTMMVKEW